MTRAGRLNDLNCLIVGGTTGIGLASARRFLDEDARLFVTGKTIEEIDLARRDLDAGDRLQAAVLEIGETSESKITEIISQALEHFNRRLDVLLHVAGISGRRFGDGA